ncbi:Tannase and feruloyl esterase [Arthrobotrys musiformis]|uniref:Carboxylic ester hydrolase n=1 Tax=Arthrobotrys musiformis TaxID=47236 RepID=A0AAV9W847_9PEZI
MRVSSIGALSGLITLSLSAVGTASFITDCQNFATGFVNEDTVVLSSTYVTEGTVLTSPDICTAAVTATANFCRVKLKVATSDSSHVITEAWLPRNWKNKGKRLLMTGNGAWGGCLPYTDMALTSSLGFAAIGHDAGHSGPWANEFTNPEIFKDWVYRSLLAATKAGKAATNHIYGIDELSKSYFMGCSTGGRQALKLAQEYPDEYDGILAAAPTVNWVNLEFGEAIVALAVGLPGSPTFLTQEQWDAVVAATMEQCDGIDGVIDGILENPARCDFRPEALLCGPGQTWALNGCLTPVQIETVKKIYSPIYGNGGCYVYPALPLGGFNEQGFPFKYGTFSGGGVQDFLRYVVYNDSSYDLRSQFNYDTGDYMIDSEFFGAQTNKTDLSGFQASGHKLLMYHGQADTLVPPTSSYDYYNAVSREMSLQPSALDQFFRFFPISSLGHCIGGTGMNYVGGPSQIQSFPGALDNVPIRNSAIMTLVDWVEKGNAPDTLRGYKLSATGEILGQKDHCRYPRKTTYKGHGDPNKRTSWKCV